MAVSITLRGRHYTVRSDEAEEEVTRVARWLDARIAEVANRTPGVDGETIVLLAALNVASEYARFRRQIAGELETVDRELAAAAAILEVTLPEAELGEEDLEEEVVPDPD
jgi:cell division protein ZapA (FtsZ GTPase activity inhibitor)